MQTTTLSSKGQVIIPKHMRTLHRWETGQDLVVIDTGDGILLRPKKPFAETSLDEVAACLKYDGETVTLDDMEEAIKRGAVEQMNDCG